MANPALNVSKSLSGRARTIELYIRRVNEAAEDKVLTNFDLDIAYAGAFLHWCTALERSLEQLFVGLLTSRLVIRGGVSPLIEVKSDRVAHSILKGDKRYVDWIPYDHTSTRAKAFLSGGRPFTRLERPQLHSLEKTHKLRNAIAHNSAHSLKVFKSEFVEGAGLPTWQQRPGGYLRGQHSGSQTRIENLIGEGLIVVKILCT